MRKLAPYAKAVAGGLATGLTALVPLLDDGVTGQEWLTVVVAALVGSGVVYAAPKNKPKGA